MSYEENFDELARDFIDPLKGLEVALDKGVPIDDMTDNHLMQLESVLSAMIGAGLIENNWELMRAAWTVALELADEIRARPSLAYMHRHREECWATLKAFVHETGKTLPEALKVSGRVSGG